MLPRMKVQTNSLNVSPVDLRPILRKNGRMSSKYLLRFLLVDRLLSARSNSAQSLPKRREEQKKKSVKFTTINKSYDFCGVVPQKMGPCQDEKCTGEVSKAWKLKRFVAQNCCHWDDAMSHTEEALGGPLINLYLRSKTFILKLTKKVLYMFFLWGLIWLESKERLSVSNLSFLLYLAIGSVTLTNSGLPYQRKNGTIILAGYVINLAELMWCDTWKKIFA